MAVWSQLKCLTRETQNSVQSSTPPDCQQWNQLEIIGLLTACVLVTFSGLFPYERWAKTLVKLAKSQTAPSRMVERAKTILFVHGGESPAETAQKLRCATAWTRTAGSGWWRIANYQMMFRIGMKRRTNWTTFNGCANSQTARKHNHHINMFWLIGSSRDSHYMWGYKKG